MALCQVSIAIAPTVEMMETSQKVVHWVHTAFGVSNLGCKGPQSAPFQGVGQGNGARPAMWVLISAILLSIMAFQGFGPNVQLALSALAFTVVGFAFVDDTDLLHLAQSPPIYDPLCPSFHHTIQQTQQALNCWEGLIHAMGGALQGLKSFWCLLEFKCQQDSWKCKSIQDTPVVLSMRDADGVR